MAWLITCEFCVISRELIKGKEVVTLYPNAKTTKYEKYREAWHLLREAAELDKEAEVGDAQSGETIGPVAGAEESPATAEPVRQLPKNAAERMEAVTNFGGRWKSGMLIRITGTEDIET